MTLHPGVNVIKILFYTSFHKCFKLKLFYFCYYIYY
jgi:hypothetical protein